MSVSRSPGIRGLPDEMMDLESPSDHPILPRNFSIDVGWGDCDPAQIAYTARIPEWVLQGVENWYQLCLTTGWYEINLDRGVGTPFVSLSCDFHSPVTPRHPLKLRVFVSKLGNSSLSHFVEGFQDGVLCFTANTTAVFVDAADMKPVPVPPNMRRNIENYIQHQGRSFE